MRETPSYGCLEDSPVGHVWAASSRDGLVAVHIGGSEAMFIAEVAALTGSAPVRDQAAVQPVLDQLAEYFAGERREFDLALDLSVLSDFQRAVLGLVSAVPYGDTITYGALAQELGMSNGARAVGRANATNPMPIVIPCHRVLGSDGKLHGYGGGNGLETKAWLLRLEGSRLL